MKEVLNTLFEYKTLSQDQAREVLVNIASERYNNSQVAAFMSVYLMRSITVAELSGFRDAMMELCLKTTFDSPETVDIVGTGGDGKDTFNVSTLACFIVAGAGIRVTKHGNYGVSSVSGSSNVLEALGYSFTNDRNSLQKQLDSSGICFLHAPLFHPAMKSVAPIRKELSVRTFFNMLGPIVNPCSPKYSLIGVYNLEMARLYHYLLQSRNAEYTIVHSTDGYDEVSLTSELKIINTKGEQLLTPNEIGFNKLNQKDLYGGSTVKESAEMFLNILKGKGTQAQNDVVCANAAFAIQCTDMAKSIEECILIAKESLVSGNALKSFNKLIN
ncbi:MAG: anthranilate phosphoribosyltransferase [Bacteroidota bacterium]|nr:anthranilate phosphoribosyltransferase [Bacteroidota bacterium]